MGFLDKAKQAAEQAQKKLEETQSNFNKGQAEKAQQQQGAAVEYDKHGRPMQADAPPAGATAPPTGQPPAADPSVAPSPAGAPTPGPAAPPAAGPAFGEPGAVPPPPADPAAASGEPAPAPGEPQEEEPLKEGVNQNPDPFRPIE
jgi:hypothetical protein